MVAVPHSNLTNTPVLAQKVGVQSEHPPYQPFLDGGWEGDAGKQTGRRGSLVLGTEAETSTCFASLWPTADTG